MMIAYLNNITLVPHEIHAENAYLLKEAIWVDLISPTKEEEQLIESQLAFDIPTKEEMQEIELSSRLYRSDGHLVMTASMIAQAASAMPYLEPVSFVLTATQLVTIRYYEPTSFKMFITEVSKLKLQHEHPWDLFLGLLEATVDRIADILEMIGQRLDMTSNDILVPLPVEHSEKIDYQQCLQEIGMNAVLNTKAGHSLVTLNRLLGFYSQSPETKLDDEGKLRISTILKDIQALSDYATFISNKVNFLLDATLGMIDIEQSTIIKIFSVAAVIFLPPTLIASIYGMNFHFMPELSYKWGYLVALGLMVVSALLPYRFFKYKKWL